MFTGIITDVGTVRSVERRGDLRVVIDTGFDLSTVTVGASIACSGMCLTVVEKSADGKGGWFAVDVSQESIDRGAPSLLETGGRLNLERAMTLGDEFGGHIVTGHVDGFGELTSMVREGDSLRLRLDAPTWLAPFLAAKGSVTVDGVSLTINEVEDAGDACRIGINLVRHTQATTTLADGPVGRRFNLEVDLIARYLHRMNSVQVPAFA